MSSISFDPVASIYDETRGFSAEVEQQIARAIDASVQATPQTRYLEVGVGTGRVAFPLASLGHFYTGVDVSEQMLARLVEKARGAGWQPTEQAWGSLPDEDATREVPVQRLMVAEPAGQLRLVTSDITHLPFADAAFDVVVAVHIFHLVSNWEQALQEVLRVLRPGGRLLHCWDTYARVADYPTREDVNKTWRQIVGELGFNAQRERVGASVETIRQWFAARGLLSVDEQVASWQQPIALSRLIEYIAGRSLSSTWTVPDDIFKTSIERLYAWAREYHSSALNAPGFQERHFVVSTIRV